LKFTHVDFSNYYSVEKYILKYGMVVKNKKQALVLISVKRDLSIVITLYPTLNFWL
jgi:hypothetical protein